MPRLPAINPSQARSPAQELLQEVEDMFGFASNSTQTMANSPAVLQGYLEFSKALSKGHLTPKLREQIALTVAAVNDCQYCLAAHTAIGKTVGLSAEAIEDSRLALSPDSRTAMVLQFVYKLVVQRGMVSCTDLEHLRSAGISNEEITEIIANVSLSLFTNYLNLVAETKLDYPEVAELPAH